MEDAKGGYHLSDGHKALGCQTCPGRSCGGKARDEPEVAAYVEHKRESCEDIQLFETSVGGEECAEDIGEGDRDDAVDKDGEDLRRGVCVFDVEQLHER